MENERRTYSRIETSLQSFMRKVSSPTAQPGLRGGFNQGVTHLRDELQQTAVPAPLLDYLEAMNAKLDTILGLLHQTSIEQDYPLTGTISQISGAGVQFFTNHPLAVGDHLELVITLSRFPLYLVNAVGTVTRNNPTSQDTSLWVLEFTSIRDNDREAIIHYVFREQREIIRGERL